MADQRPDNSSLPNWVIRLIDRSIRNEEYGKWTVHMKAGEVTHVRQERTFVGPEGRQTDQPED